MNRWNERLCKLLEVAVALLVAATVLVVLWGVFSRFVVSVPSRWTEELATNFLTWVALLGAAVAFRKHQHLGVDYFYNKLDPSARQLNAVVIQVLVVIFAVCIMIWGGANLVAKTWATGQVTAALGLRVGLTYLSVPISGVAIVLFAIEEIGAIGKRSRHPTETADSLQRTE